MLNFNKLTTTVLPLLLVASSLCAGEVNQAPLHQPSEKTVEMPELDFEALKDGTLSVKAEEVAPFFGEKAVSSGYSVFGYYPSGVTLLPYAQDLVFTSGELCHIANYTYVTVVTMLSGPTYGYQVIMTTSGLVLSTQDLFYIDSNINGVYLRHEYYDVTIVTGTDQVVYFK
ncbi:MAG: hypothetical protein LLG04_18465 [Parachlamydia sp.]|nr:hypothetical protein [Parachlamydia sp.]